MNPESIINKLFTILDDDTANLAYVKRVFKGARQDVKVTQLPCILIEPVTNIEDNVVYQTENLVLTVNIMAYTRIHKKDSQLVGNDGVPGVLDLEQDIKLALGEYNSSDHTLDGTVYDFTFQSTTYDVLEDFPVRGVIIETAFRYRQNFVTRA